MDLNTCIYVSRNYFAFILGLSKGMHTWCNFLFCFLLSINPFSLIGLFQTELVTTAIMNPVRLMKILDTQPCKLHKIHCHEFYIIYITFLTQNNCQDFVSLGTIFYGMD